MGGVGTPRRALAPSSLLLFFFLSALTTINGQGSPPPNASALAADAAAYRASQEQQLLQEGYLQLFSLASVDSLAVCNDGSAGGYYFNPAQNGPNAPWLIYLMGGDWCYDQESCETRMQDTEFQVSSSNWMNFIQLSGVFDTGGGNPFASWNKVYIEYCSSDAWMGDIGASPATFNMNFRGQRIVSATLSDLAATQGLPTGAQVVFAGCSAGARGAMVTLDLVAGMLPPGADVRGLLDSGMWVDVAPSNSLEMSLMQQAQLAYGLFSPTALVPSDCASAYSGSEWQCIYGQYRMPFVTTPYFLNAAQFDDFQLLYDTGGTVPTSVDEVQYADGFQRTTLAALQSTLNPGNGVFSTTCLAHCLTSNTTYMNNYQANGQNIAQAIANWLQGTTVQDVSSCTGYPCVEQCPGGSQIYGIQEAIASSAPGARMQSAAMGEQRSGASFEEGSAGGPGVAPGGFPLAINLTPSPPPAAHKSIWLFQQMGLMGLGVHRSGSGPPGRGSAASSGESPGPIGDASGSDGGSAAASAPAEGASNSWLMQGHRRLLGRLGLSKGGAV